MDAVACKAFSQWTLQVYNGTYNQNEQPGNVGRAVQHHKTIYFSDLAGNHRGRRGLTVAFGPDDADLFQSIEHLSSARLRKLIGVDSFDDLERAAQDARTNINHFCKIRLSEHVASGLLTDDGAFKDQLQVTFAGGRHDPLHNWFPYLEGYSPDFVWEVYSRYCDGAERVLDPFAGSGTTPMTIMGLGKTGLFSDVNPLCIHVIKAKSLARTLSYEKRCEYSEKLLALAKIAKDKTASYPRHQKLDASYRATFGKSEFFSPEQYETILGVRSVLDQVDISAVRQLAEVAAIRSLIPASRLIRRGDLRFKREDEERRGTDDFIEAFCSSLELIANDLHELKPSNGSILQVGMSALENRYNDGLDAVITSPPYLNGTNYFRNTKVELWFLGHLNSKADLSAFRDKAITAGINDVTRAKSNRRDGKFESRKLDQIVSQINECAYDQRIPAMVRTYFNDMHEALRPALAALPEHGRVCIDIGDSVYGGVHVPTDQLIVEICERLGFELKDDVTLRERISRSGQKLRQSLLVLEKPSKGRVERISTRSKWQSFKTSLPHREPGMAARNWGNKLHSLCSYQGKLKPAIASSLVDIFVGDGGSMLDPFSGVGTIPFEASLRGATSFAFEISPSAFRISHAKLSSPSRAQIDEVLKSLEAFLRDYRACDAEIERALQIKFNKKLDEYFHPDTFNEVLGARKFMALNACSSPALSMVHATLQHILHGNRPYALSRRSHPLTPYSPTGPFEYRSLMERLRTKIERSLEVDRGDKFREGQIWQMDSTDPWPDEINDLDAVITSPPFFDSTRFYLGNWMRLWFSGWEVEDFRIQPQKYIDERQKTGFDVYEPIIRQSRERLKLGGFLVLHLGESKKCDMAEEVAKVAQPFFRTFDVFSESVEHCEKHGLRDKGSVTAHQYLVLQS